MLPVGTILVSVLAAVGIISMLVLAVASQREGDRFMAIVYIAGIVLFLTVIATW